MVMAVPWPWETFGQTLFWVGIAFSLWRISSRILYLYRKPGDTAGQMLTLELKMNKILEKSKGKARQYIVERAMDVSDCIDEGDFRKATRCLLRVLHFIGHSVNSEDLQSELALDHQFCAYVRKLLITKTTCRLPPENIRIVTKSGDKLVELVCQGNMRDVIMEMCKLYQKLSTLGQQHNPYPINNGSSAVHENDTNGTPALL